MRQPLPIVDPPSFGTLKQLLLVPSPWGTLELRMTDNLIWSCKFIDDVKSEFRQFHLPSDCSIALPIPSEFECNVKRIVMETMPGETISYGEVARRAGSPKAAQAVGNAMSWNSCALIVPCHRVVKADGSTAGYRWGIRRCKSILAHERRGGDDLFVFDLPAMSGK